MRALPNMIVLKSDATSTRWATKYAVDTYGPMYLRLSRDVYGTCMTRTRSSSAAGRDRARRYGRDRHRLRHPRAQGARGGRADGRARHPLARGGQLHQAHRPRAHPALRVGDGRDRHRRGAQHLRAARQRRGGKCSPGAARGAPTEFVGIPTRLPRPASTLTCWPSTVWTRPASCAASSGCSRASTEFCTEAGRAGRLPAF